MTRLIGLPTSKYFEILKRRTIRDGREKRETRINELGRAEHCLRTPGGKLVVVFNFGD